MAEIPEEEQKAALYRQQQKDRRLNEIQAQRDLSGNRVARYWNWAAWQPLRKHQNR